MTRHANAPGRGGPTSKLRLTATALLAACATSGSPPDAAVPHIDSIDPMQAPAGEAYPLTLRIAGGPFDEEGNRVHFGDVVIDDVPSADGTTLVVRVPKSVRSAPEVPPRVLQAGTYDVMVETSAGRSQPVTFTLTGPAAASKLPGAQPS